MNPHDLYNQQILSLVCLPIPPPSLKQALEVFSSMLGVVPLPGVMLEALDDASGLSWSDVASLASSLPCLDYLVIIAYYVGLVGGMDSFVSDCFLMNALSSGVSSHSQISSCPLLSIFLKVFKAMMSSYPQQSYFTGFSEICQSSS